MRRFLIALNMLTLLVLVAVLIVVAGFEWHPGRVDAAPALPEAAPKPKIAAFNMEKVLMEYKKRMHQDYLLEEERKELLLEVSQMKTRLTNLQSEIKRQPDPNVQESLEKQRRELGRQIEDKERENNKKLNVKSSIMNSAVYGEVNAVVGKLAETSGYDIVFAYPDAASQYERQFLMNKEAKLKLSAAQPFFVSKNVDLTEVVIKTLNHWYPPPEIPFPQPQTPVNPKR